MTEKLRALALAAKIYGINASRQTAEQIEDGVAELGTDIDGDFYNVGILDLGQYYATEMALPLAEYIAEANPTNILALLDEIDKLKAENAGLLGALVKLEAMSERYRPVGYPLPDAQLEARAAIASARKQGEQG
jgi:hypothetical protein